MPKSRKEQIEDIIENAIFVGENSSLIPNRYCYAAIIDRPNILVKLCINNFSTLGWAKANWPDKWDENFGVKVALGKAASAMIKNGH